MTEDAKRVFLFLIHRKADCVFVPGGSTDCSVAAGYALDWLCFNWCTLKGNIKVCKENTISICVKRK